MLFVIFQREGTDLILLAEPDELEDDVVFTVVLPETWPLVLMAA